MRYLIRMVVAGCALGAVTLTGMPAWAHGDIERSAPAAGSTLRRAPDSVIVQLTEPPARGSHLVVTDGCRRPVSGSPRIAATSNLVASISEGQPGRWRVNVRSLSSVDGHLVRESFAFRVRGQRDCSQEAEPDDAGEDDEVELGEPQPPLRNDETSFPIVPFALGTALVVAAALVLRRRS